MIITRAPLRISFAGGGTDIRNFYKDDFGCVLSTTINKYVYIELHPFFFRDRIQLKYSKTENVKSFDDIQHNIFRVVLKKYRLKGYELTCTADLPAGTGMGSSSAFTVALLQAVHTLRREYRSAEMLAKEACDIEIKNLKNPIGKQDQYASAYGGLNFITFSKNEEVFIEPISLSTKKKIELNNNLLMFYTGITRDANKILNEQKIVMAKDKQAIESLSKIKQLAINLKKELIRGNIDAVGDTLHENWLIKKNITKKISSDFLNNIYKKAIENGAIGGKLLGAGGGGCFVFYCKKNKRKLINAMKEFKLELFNFETSGTQTVFYDE